MLQYTNIKDKERNEVYVGDKLLDTLTKREYVVKFGFCKKYCYTGFYVESEDGYQGQLNNDTDCDYNSQILIIGNIYE